MKESHHRNWLIRRRKRLGFSQDKLAADMNNLGIQITGSTIGNWERGKTDIPFSPELARALQVALQYESLSDLLIEAGFELELHAPDELQEAIRHYQQLSHNNLRHVARKTFEHLVTELNQVDHRYTLQEDQTMDSN